MKGHTLAVALLLSCLLLGFLAASGTNVRHDHTARREKLNKILELVDMPTVDSREFLGGGEKTGHVTESWTSFSEDVQELHVSLLGLVRELGREVKEELVSELKAEGPDFRARWQRAYDKAKASIAALQTGHIQEEIKSRLKAFETKMKETGEKQLKGKWKKVKSKLVEEFEYVEKLLEKELSVLSAKIDKIFHRHHPVLKCGSCGKQLTLKEFMQHYPDLMLDEEDWWNDLDVENFYLGWPEWANRYAVKCPQCGATDWGEVDFVSSEEEHQLEEQVLGEHSNAPHEIME